MADDLIEIEVPNTLEFVDEGNEIDSDQSTELEGADEGAAALNSSENHVVIEKSDRSLSEFHRWYKSGRLNIEPECQRNYIWDNLRASRLIESFLIEIPVPVIYFRARAY